ncbi:hypothetical protein [Flexibacterium corallicola]|uniref:hypothetical protein n=1 Tax=Flexibacterium corallicola TaxID=3037259 RepID=UPI00286F8253|nr:hypothetical protein [Pseudovibrio sp. M1P-2-3]
MLSESIQVLHDYFIEMQEICPELTDSEARMFAYHMRRLVKVAQDQEILLGLPKQEVAQEHLNDPKIIQFPKSFRGLHYNLAK